jgi:uncharacterized protein (UPF0335 family)
MPESINELKEVLSKDQNLAKFVDAIDEIETENRNLVRESMSRKDAIRNMHQSLKDVGFDPTKPINDQLENFIASKVSEKTKDTKPLSDFDKLNKNLADVMQRLERSETEAKQANRKIKVEKVKNSVTDLLSSSFGKATNLIVKSAISDGQIEVDDDGNAVLNIDGQQIDLQDKDKFVATMRKSYQDLLFTEQKGGSNSRSTYTSNNAKMISLSDFETLSQAEKRKYMTEVGKFI